MNNTLGSRLKDLRIEKELSLKDLSQELGISLATLSNYERNERKPDFETLIAFSNYFNVTTDYLLCTTDIRNVYETSYTMTSEAFEYTMNNLDVETKSQVYHMLTGVLATIDTVITHSDNTSLDSLHESYKYLFGIYTNTILCAKEDTILQTYRTYKHHKNNLDSNMDQFIEHCIEISKSHTSNED